MPIEGFGEIAERLRRSTVQISQGGRRYQGSGSGLIWNSAGLIVTNAHVARPDRVDVTLWDGRSFNGEVTTRDTRHDLATVKILMDGLPTATLDDSSRVRPGELIVAVGNPLGFIGALTTGVVHAVGPLRGFGRRTWVQAAVRLAPGNSGGPLANAKGRVIGLNTMVTSGGLALAVPSNTVAAFVNHGGSRASLGVVVQPVAFERGIGLLILQVAPKGPADLASLLIGDVLIGVDGRPFYSVDDLGDAIESSRGILSLQFLRGDRRTTRGGHSAAGANRSGSCVIRVLIAASSAIARAGLESLLKPAESIELVTTEDADVIVADEEIPDDLVELGPKAAIVLLVADPQPATTIEALRSGVRAVLSRDASPNRIIAAIEAVAAGLLAIEPEDLEPWLGNPKPLELSEPLTSRETEVLGMIAGGLANKVIAHRLGISEHTVKFHVTSIMSKLHAASRTEAVTLGIRRGLILV